jgi:hypothetical protein
VRVAYLQWDSPMIRIVVVNLDRPGRTSYINLGETVGDPISILWKTPEKLELRKGSTTFAVVDADPDPSLRTDQALHSSPPSLLPLDESATQMLLQRKLPHRSIRIINWDEANRRIILLAAAANDSGRFFVYDRSLDLLFEVARRKIRESNP